MSYRETLTLFFKHRETQRFIEQMQEICVPSGFPSLNYLGVNFSHEISAIKLYFTFFHTLAIPQVKKFLPQTVDFEKYYPFWEESKEISLQHTGCAFTLKANADSQFTRGFHLRFRLDKKTEPLFERPHFITLAKEDMANYPGISFEYKNDTVRKKKYYYITSETTKQIIAEQWKNPDIAHAEVIEYTEMEQKRKIILWSREVSGVENIKTQFSAEHLAFNRWMEKEMKLNNYYDGIYLKSPQRASYFGYLENNKSIPLDFSLNKKVDTVSYLRKMLSL